MVDELEGMDPFAFLSKGFVKISRDTGTGGSFSHPR